MKFTNYIEVEPEQQLQFQKQSLIKIESHCKNILEKKDLFV